MKLSDVKGERTLDVIADVIEPITNIAQDENAAALFKREKLPEGKTPRGYTLERARKAAPPLIRSHKQDIITILASIEGTPVQDYTQSLNLLKLTRDLIELLSDEAWWTLFISAQTGEGEISSGSAQENTEGSEPSEASAAI